MGTGRVARAAVEWRFVMPASRGLPSGGNHYNAALGRALRARGHTVRQVAASAALDGAGYVGTTRVTLVDSLYLHAFCDAPDCGARSRRWLLLHYLPSLVRDACAQSAWQMHPSERTAIERAEVVIVTSDTMAARVLEQSAPRKLAVIEPGRKPERARLSRPHPSSGVRALMVANLIEGKGVLPLLRALTRRNPWPPKCSLRVIGRQDMQPDYARACQRWLESRADLQQRVQFLGAQSRAQVVRAMADSHLLLSASRMESNGMALAEARMHGLPILARRGGHIERWVQEAAGGECFDSDAQLATACRRLVQSPDELARRLLAADRARPPARHWLCAADELCALL